MSDEVKPSRSVDWVGVEKIGERRILDALALALRGKSIPEISQETGIPSQSLYDIKAHGPYSHRNKVGSAP
jgi:hypothetical protein